SPWRERRGKSDLHPLSFPLDHFSNVQHEHFRFLQVIQDPMLREREQLRSILTTLLQRAGDQHPGIRRMALKGLGNIVLVAPDKVNLALLSKMPHLQLVLGGFGQFLVRKKIILGSLMNFRSWISPFQGFTCGQHLSFLFKDITLKTTTYMSDDNTDLRKAALHLFGVLAEWTKLRYKRFFTEQVRKSLVPLLIHQRDPSPKVSEVSCAGNCESVQLWGQKCDNHQNSRNAQCKLSRLNPWLLHQTKILKIM
uniref:Maestro/Maestro-like HEAT-repeats domain-containing protein n=1 Tax=Anolis carolinensis TaxID=28377 RepID=A0A803T3L1_ANOCA